MVDFEIQHFKGEFFKSLAHPLRIHILELLSEGEKSVQELQTLIGSEGSTVSQQLSVLRAKNVVIGTKKGSRVTYSLRDQMIKDLLGIARTIFNNHLLDTISILDRFNKENLAGANPRGAPFEGNDCI
jgi:DNA-binding transcriptional ArsR family regulator